jgi:hypothetical protein
MLNRLRLVREVDTIRQAVPPDSFRSAAVVEAQLRAAVLKKTLEDITKDKGGVGGGGAAGAGAVSGGSSSTFAPSSSSASGSASAAPPRSLGRVPAHYPTAASPTPTPTTPAPSFSSAPPPLPFVYRRASRDVQITDPSTGDLLQLDRGSWVLTAAAPHAATHLLPVYTVDPKTGLVVVYDIPVPNNHLPNVFDLHTLNMIETLSEPAASAAHPQPPPPAATSFGSSSGTHHGGSGPSGMVLPDAYHYYAERS